MATNKYRCIRCNDKIIAIHPSEDVKPWQGMWSGGAVDKITAGFGSAFDMDSFVIAICDECISAKLKKLK